MPFIEPKVLKGFRDFLPSSEMLRLNLIEKIETSLRSFGFMPIDTPALEYAEILLGKGGGETEKQIYRFKDNGERDIALRFDLTVPFARFSAQHYSELIFPFKRYHIGKVWRGENSQRGRYREFIQCDFDIIGSGSPAADFEILLMIHHTLSNLGAGEISIKINHRGLFNRFLSHIGLEEKSADILRAVDKISKAGLDETKQAVSEIAGEIKGQKIIDFIFTETTFDETLERITELSGGPSIESERLKLIKRFMDDASISNFTLTPSITRGLDYYTGIVFETFLTELPEIGSICSGGRYDNLAGLYSKNSISGVGTSIGLDRMIAALESLKRLPPVVGFCITGIACLREEKSGLYQALSDQFRYRGIPCEVFLEPCDLKQMSKQFILAEKKGLRWMVIPGENPLCDPLTLRNLASRKNYEGISLEETVKIITTHPLLS